MKPVLHVVAHCAMRCGVTHVLPMVAPREMIWVDAGQMAVAADMPHKNILMFRRAQRQKRHVSRRRNTLPAKHHMCGHVLLRPRNENTVVVFGVAMILDKRLDRLRVLLSPHPRGAYLGSNLFLGTYLLPGLRKVPLLAIVPNPFTCWCRYRHITSDVCTHSGYTPRSRLLPVNATLGDHPLRQTGDIQVPALGKIYRSRGDTSTCAAPRDNRVHHGCHILAQKLNIHCCLNHWKQRVGALDHSPELCEMPSPHAADDLQFVADAVF